MMRAESAAMRAMPADARFMQQTSALIRYHSAIGDAERISLIRHARALAPQLAPLSACIIAAAAEPP